MKTLKIAGLILGTILIAYLSAWALQDDKSKPPSFKPKMSDHNGTPPGKH
ncbi:hypothetical protein [Hirschia baltica]|nr:hypothetical protein [Hirschia baltica]